MNKLKDFLNSVDEEHRLSLKNTLESIELEDVFKDHLLGIEQLGEYLETLEHIEDSLEEDSGLDSTLIGSLEHYQEAFKDDFISTEGLFSFMGKSANQTYKAQLQEGWEKTFLNYLEELDSISELIIKSQGGLKKHRMRLEDIKTHLIEREKTIKEKTVNVNYGGIGYYWFINGQYVSNADKQLQLEIELSDYVFNDYVKLIEKEMDQLGTLCKKGKYHAIEDFNRTITSALTKKRHPVQLFDSQYLNKQDYLINCLLKIQGRKSDNRNVLNTLSNPQKVHLKYKPIMGLTKVKYNYQMDLSTLKQVINKGETLLVLTERYIRYTDQMKKRMNALKSDLDVMMNTARKGNDKKVIIEIKKLGRYAKLLIDCYWSPSLFLAERNIKVIRGVCYLTGRLTAKFL